MWAKVLGLCHEKHILLIPHESFNGDFWLPARSLCGTNYGKCGALALVLYATEKGVC